MAAKVDIRVAHCFRMLKAAEFIPLVDFLKEMRADSLEVMAATMDDTLIKRRQGNAETLKTLLDHIRDADQLVSKLQKK